MTQPRTSAGQNFQDNILGTLRDRSQLVTLYLKSRLSVRGRVMDFDPYVVLVQPLDGGPLQMVYKSAIVSMSYPPARPMRGPRPGGRPPFREGGRPPYREGGRPPYREGERPPYREGGRPPAPGDRPPYREGPRPPYGPDRPPDRSGQPPMRDADRSPGEPPPSHRDENPPRSRRDDEP